MEVGHVRAGHNHQDQDNFSLSVKRVGKVIIILQGKLIALGIGDYLWILFVEVERV